MLEGNIVATLHSLTKGEASINHYRAVTSQVMTKQLKHFSRVDKVRTITAKPFIGDTFPKNRILDFWMLLIILFLNICKYCCGHAPPPVCGHVR